jgi:hypothetical protein
MSTLAVNTVTDANGGNTATINSMTPTADSLQGFRNRIINGDMRISQRGTSFTGLTDGSSQYTVDRWRWLESGTSTGVQTVTQDTSAPTGFVNSWKVQTTTAQSPLSSNNAYRCIQPIEGNNISDLAWGTAAAQTITVSFWVRSSLTGTFGGSITNAGNTRHYVFSYTINAADTWEYKTIIIAGDTSGTWGAGTGTGLILQFSFGAGSDYLTTPGSWGSTRVEAPTGQVNVVGTLNATWYITGVQLEVGSVATPFERRPFGTELSLCKRYYEKSWPLSTTPGTSNYNGRNWLVINGGLSRYMSGRQFIVEKRAAPTITIYHPNGTSGQVSRWSDDVGLSATVIESTTLGWGYTDVPSGSSASNAFTCHWVASSEL